MEFLMGRALGNNMINLKAYKEFSEALEELGLDINAIEEATPLAFYEQYFQNTGIHWC